MNEQGFKELISGQERGPLASMARGGLRILSLGYAAAIRFRNALYDFRLRKVHQVHVPVISVGNITAGGTGKTPVVALLANALTRRGHRPGLLSRGYRTLEGQSENDEKRLLDRLCPGVPHVQDPDRVQAAKRALAGNEISVFVLDDGFQHRRLHRDLDVVLIDATNPFGFGHVLPRGLMREPLVGLRRADVLVVTRCGQVSQSQLNDLRSSLEAFGRPVVEIDFVPTELVTPDGSESPLSALADRHVAAFCGIGNPSAFEDTLTACGLHPVFVQQFEDHVRYQSSDVEKLKRRAAAEDVSALVCTEKDLVKLTDWKSDACQLLALRIEARVMQGEDALMAAITGVLSGG